MPETQQPERGPAHLPQSVLENIGYNGMLLWWSPRIQFICHIFYVTHELTCNCNAIDNLYVVALGKIWKDTAHLTQGLRKGRSWEMVALGNILTSKTDKVSRLQCLYAR